jgi:nicotinamide-nucleotide amidase
MHRIPGVGVSLMENLSYQLADEVGKQLIEKQTMLCVAESCTGGLIGHLITNITGSSNYFLGGIQAYSYQTKVDLVGVKQSTLDRYGAVSQETALEMARGIRQVFSPQCALDKLISLSVTGIAGPGGGTPQKPVGLVWIGLSSHQGDFTWKCNWNSNREGNKMASAIAALEHLLEVLKK